MAIAAVPAGGLLRASRYRWVAAAVAATTLGSVNAKADPPQPTLYVAPRSRAHTQADGLRRSDPQGAALLDAMAAQPLAVWLGDWTEDIRGTVDAAVLAGGAQLRTFVVYDIPHRDCGAASAGGAITAAGYRRFVDRVAAGLAGRPALVVLEPDALALENCLGPVQISERRALISGAVDTLGAAGARVYVDAGDPAWIPPAEMATRLSAAGVERAAGFALDVAHTETTADNVTYAEALRAILGEHMHYVIDTSRNGRGPPDDHAWCNPRGCALGAAPTLVTGVPGLDALLWVKVPGESDGACNGGPPAGVWWGRYALGLAQAQRPG